MSKYGLGDAAKDTGVSSKEASRAWHQAREDARRSGEIPSKGEGGCFIATAAYGDRDSASVRILREFRDEYLLPRSAGRLLVRMYYRLSPSLAFLVKEHNFLRVLTRWLLTPIIHALRK